MDTNAVRRALYYRATGAQRQETGRSLRYRQLREQGSHLTGRFVRVAEEHRPGLTFEVDGRPCRALEGDTLMVAILQHSTSLRRSEFGDGPRAGFCLMGACQDCWVWTRDGDRLRACTTPVREGLRILTEPPEAAGWPNPA